MRRVVVLGPPESGKSTLARKIGEAYDLPVFHLDQAYWRTGWTRVPDLEFARTVEELAAQPTWVIDGNYTTMIEPRLAAADTVIYLDVPPWVCITRVLRRILVHRNRVRRDAAPGCPERLSFEFLVFVWTWQANERARTLRFAETFSGCRIILRGRDARSPWRAWGALTPSRRPS